MLRLIDTASIRKNPSAGRTCFLEPYGLAHVEEVYRDGVLVSRKTTRDMGVVHLMNPAPLYLFEYEPLVVQCRSCGRKVEYSKLESDSWDDDLYNDQVCPHCKEWDCVGEEIVDETIEAALVRKGQDGS